MSPPSRFINAAIAIAVASTWITPFQRDLFVGDETKYGQVVREMRATGAFFLPTLNGVPFTHKPPLHFWMIDLLTYPLGLYSTWAFVLPSLLAFLFLLWLMWRMGGPLAAFICGTSLMVWGSAQTARMDISFTAFIVLGAWMLQKALDADDSHALFASGVALGVATLIKGPMAPVIGIVLFLLEVWRRRRFPRVRYSVAIAALIGIPMLWLVPAMVMGGSTYTHEVIVKQTVGRAVSAWVHNAPPWFYLLHMPLVLLPWFFPALAAVRGANRFYVNWILAVLVPYSVMSSKLDVYMMAMIPPVALMIADRVSLWANRVTLLALVVIVAVVALFVPSVPAEAKPLLVILGAVSALALVTWKSPLFSTLAVGFVSLVPLIFAAFTLMPLANDIGSTRRLIAAIQKQHVPPETVALYTCPYLWSRDFPRELERVRYVDADNIGTPAVIATSRAHASEIAPVLPSYRHVDQLQMIRKWFDVYRR
ncbi:MAG TPA: glycosyltransferase family 39 protein [Thermoanaerobaculia bacterium]